MDTVQYKFNSIGHYRTLLSYYWTLFKELSNESLHCPPFLHSGSTASIENFVHVVYRIIFITSSIRSQYSLKCLNSKFLVSTEGGITSLNEVVPLLQEHSLAIPVMSSCLKSTSPLQTVQQTRLSARLRSQARNWQGA